MRNNPTVKIILGSLLLLAASCSKKSTTTPTNPQGDTTTTVVTPPKPPVPAKKWIVSTVAGSIPGFQDGDTTQAQFSYPQGLFADNHGNIWVADEANFAIRQVTYKGHVTTYASRTIGNPNPTYGNMYALIGDTLGNLYTTESNYIRKISSPANSFMWAGALALDYLDGTGTNAHFDMIGNLTMDHNGNIFLPDYDRKDSIHIRKVTPDGVVSTLAMQNNTGYPDNGLSNYHYLYAIAVDPTGNLYVSGNGNCLIKKVDLSGNVSIFAGAGDIGFVDGKGRTAKFFDILGMTCDAAGNLWVCDGDNHAIRKVTPDGNVSTIAGLGRMGNTDGDSTQATFKYPYGITIDNTGTVFVADNGNCRIRKLEYK
jgi:sugar lactone lactonase YvrE